MYVVGDWQIQKVLSSQGDAEFPQLGKVGPSRGHSGRMDPAQPSATSNTHPPTLHASNLCARSYYASCLDSLLPRVRAATRKLTPRRVTPTRRQTSGQNRTAALPRTLSAATKIPPLSVTPATPASVISPLLQPFVSVVSSFKNWEHGHDMRRPFEPAHYRSICIVSASVGPASAPA